jgi:hypothetical protein
MFALVERFFAGYTSGAEEKELYAYFASDSVAAELEPYRSFFGYVEEEMPVALAAVEPLPLSPQRANRRFALRMIASAAVVAALIAVGLAVATRGRVGEADPFAGSYIIRNGVRITDPKIIRPELEATLRMLEEQEAYLSIAERRQAIYEEVISRFPDESREAVRIKLHQP